MKHEKFLDNISLFFTNNSKKVFLSLGYSDIFLEIVIFIYSYHITINNLFINLGFFT